MREKDCLIVHFLETELQIYISCLYGQILIRAGLQPTNGKGVNDVYFTQNSDGSIDIDITNICMCYNTKTDHLVPCDYDLKSRWQIIETTAQKYLLKQISGNSCSEGNMCLFYSGKMLSEPGLTQCDPNDSRQLFAIAKKGEKIIDPLDKSKQPKNCLESKAKMYGVGEEWRDERLKSERRSAKCKLDNGESPKSTEEMENILKEKNIMNIDPDSCLDQLQSETESDLNVLEDNPTEDSPSNNMENEVADTPKKSTRGSSEIKNLTSKNRKSDLTDSPKRSTRGSTPENHNQTSKGIQNPLNPVRRSTPQQINSTGASPHEKNRLKNKIQNNALANSNKPSDLKRKQKQQNRKSEGQNSETDLSDFDDSLDDSSSSNNVSCFTEKMMKNLQKMLKKTNSSLTSTNPNNSIDLSKGDREILACMCKKIKQSKKNHNNGVKKHLNLRECIQNSSNTNNNDPKADILDSDAFDLTSSDSDTNNFNNADESNNEPLNPENSDIDPMNNPNFDTSTENPFDDPWNPDSSPMPNPPSNTKNGRETTSQNSPGKGKSYICYPFPNQIPSNPNPVNPSLDLPTKLQLLDFNNYVVIPLIADLKKSFETLAKDTHKEDLEYSKKIGGLYIVDQKLNRIREINASIASGVQPGESINPQKLEKLIQDIRREFEAMDYPEIASYLNRNENFLSLNIGNVLLDDFYSKERNSRNVYEETSGVALPIGIFHKKNPPRIDDSAFKGLPITMVDIVRIGYDIVVSSINQQNGFESMPETYDEFVQKGGKLTPEGTQYLAHVGSISPFGPLDMSLIK